MTFFVIDRDLHQQTNFAESEHFNGHIKVGEPERCPVCKGAVSMLELLPPISVKLTSRFYPDFIFGEITPFIVSENFRDAYVTSGLTGISTFKEVDIVKVRGTAGSPQVKYFLPGIERGEAKVDEVRSRFRRSGEIKCMECKRGSIIESFEGLSFIPGTWRQEDVFYAKWLSGIVFATERFIKFIIDNKFSNAQFKKALDYKSQF